MNNGNENAEKIGVYPYTTLATALTIADAVKALGGAGNTPVSKSLLASTLKEDARSQNLTFKIASARNFGMIEGRSRFTLTESAKRYYFPASPTDRRDALVAFLETPRAFKMVAERFDGSKLPEREILGNILHREAKVPESWKDRIAASFAQSAKFASVMDDQGYLRIQAVRDGLVAKERDSSEGGSVNAAPKEPAPPSGGDRIARTPSEMEPTQPGYSRWVFLCGGASIRLETPEKMTKDLWDKLSAYVAILKPADEPK